MFGMFLKCVIMLLSTIFLVCTPTAPDKDHAPDLPHPGMKKIASNGKSFHQGWDDTLASVDEKPGMQSSFTYDYWLDTIEVTQKRFFDLTGRRPVADTSAYGVGDYYPVYFVTWFDAAVFCNARSKLEGLDTVYIYSRKDTLQNGTIYELTGLRYDFNRDGYRLPTEAEWEFAARGGSSTLPFSTAADSAVAESCGWFASNASSRTHTAATKQPNALGLYDLAGNVFEWTNDWKGSYGGQPIENSAGMLQPGSSYEKVIKGGAWLYGMMYMRPSHRSATYATTLSAACEYVGFRCARGVMPHNQYIDAQQLAFTPNPVTIAMSGNALRSFTGASESRLVFVNVTGQNRTLCYIDFSRTFPFVREYLDDRNVYLPVISPDGRYVAYCSRNEGLSGPSQVTIRSLDSLNSPLVKLPADSAFVPRWWVNQTTGDTCIVYTNSAIANGSPLWNSTKTFVQKISGGNPAGAARELVADGSYHDGISTDGRYIVSAYNSLIMRNLLNNEEHQLFHSPQNGKDANGSVQVCNASIAPDSSGRCLFLDFGYQRTSAVTGGSYGIHQYLFVSNFADSISRAIRCPANERSWDYPEWSNRGQYAVSCCRNDAGQAHGVYVVDLLISANRLMVSGVELHQAYLWVGEKNSFIDSIGAYNDPPMHLTQAMFASRMHFFWQLHDSIKYLFVGSSHTAQGIDPHAFQKHKVYNLAYIQCHLAATCEIIRKYVLTHCNNLKFIGIDFIPGLMSEPIENDYFHIGVGRSKGYVFDSNHFFWKEGLTNSILSTLIEKPYSVIPGQDSLNLNYGPCVGWGGDNPGTNGNANWDTTLIEYKRNLIIWEELISELNGLGINLLLYITPESPAFAEHNYSGVNGPSVDVGRQIVARFKEFENRYPFFHLYDANQFGNHDYSTSEFIDPDHLCTDGAAKFSKRIDSVMTTIMQ